MNLGGKYSPSAFLNTNIHPKTLEVWLKLSKPSSELIQFLKLAFLKKKKKAVYMGLVSFCLKINSKDFCCLPSKWT